MGNTVIQTRNDTAINWTTNNPTLALGEVGLETDTKRMKVGDSSTAWNALDYYGIGASFKYGLYTLSVHQADNLAVDDHVEFDTSAGSLGGLATGSGQENGIITLANGKSYKITLSLNSAFSDSGNYYVGLGIYDRTNSVYLQQAPLIAISAANTTGNYRGDLMCIFTPINSVDIDVRILAVSGLTTIYSNAGPTPTALLIEEYGGY